MQSVFHRTRQGDRGFRYGAFHGNRETMPPPLQLPFSRKIFPPCASFPCPLISLRCFRSTSAICRLWSACMFCILSCRASMVSSWSATSYAGGVLLPACFVPACLPKRTDSRRCWRLRSWLPFQPFGLYLFFARSSSSRAVSFRSCNSTTSVFSSSVCRFMSR